MEGAGRRGVDGLEGRRGLSGWTDRTARTQPHKPNCNKNRTETEAKPVPETETNRNEPWLYCIWLYRGSFAYTGFTVYSSGFTVLQRHGVRGHNYKEVDTSCRQPVCRKEC